MNFEWAKGPTLYLVFPAIVISAVFTFYPKVQEKHCRKHYDYDRKNRIQITRDTSPCYIMTLNTALPRKRDSFWVKKIGCTSGSFQNILHKRRNYFYGICRTKDATRCQQQITYSWNAVQVLSFCVELRALSHLTRDLS